MNRIANRIARLGLAGSVALLSVLPAAATASPGGPVESWSAMADIPAPDLRRLVENMPVSAEATQDQPYCASDDEIAFTLRHDFAEEVIVTAGAAGTELWASDILGTWSVVAPRADDTSCIIASGVGYSTDREAEMYYSSLGF
ncbi:hypothetical protein [Paracoccus sp. NSM]|uniref:hypothetical protein n=1 Tax=Paracoccus sp. NSM TaxID=3457784 RepID=UPI00403595C9